MRPVDRALLAPMLWHFAARTTVCASVGTAVCPFSALPLCRHSELTSQAPVSSQPSRHFDACVYRARERNRDAAVGTPVDRLFVTRLEDPDLDDNGARLKDKLCRSGYRFVALACRLSARFGSNGVTAVYGCDSHGEVHLRTFHVGLRSAHCGIHQSHVVLVLRVVGKIVSGSTIARHSPSGQKPPDPCPRNSLSWSDTSPHVKRDGQAPHCSRCAHVLTDCQCLSLFQAVLRVWFLVGFSKRDGRFVVYGLQHREGGLSRPISKCAACLPCRASYLK